MAKSKYILYSAFVIFVKHDTFISSKDSKIFTVIKLNKNVALTSLAWGLFFVLIGISLVAAYYGVKNVAPYFAIGIGIILIGLNLSRKGLGMRLSIFGLFIGIVAICLGGTVFLGLSLWPWGYAIIIVLIGLFVIAEAAESLGKRKAIQ
jgi:peptidoglycan/LPS O-acetylase OafA/YrhL